MEPSRDKIRYKLELAKLPVLKVDRIPTGYRFVLDMPNGVKMVVDVPASADIREGDLLTLYTEIYAYAQSSTTSIQ